MGVVIEPWLDVKKATTDELHRPLEELGVAFQPLLIQYEVDLEAQRQGKRLLTEGADSAPGIRGGPELGCEAGTA